MSAFTNIYDDPAFFAQYRKLRESQSGLNEVLEQPAIWSMLPETLAGLSILDMGCGFGDFARGARALGAASIVGIDVSKMMLAAAIEQTVGEGIEYREMRIEELTIPGRKFDLIVSSLALHYVRDYRDVLRKVAAHLKRGGLFVFSVEHPICTARSEQQWIRDQDGKALYWPIDNYRLEGERRTQWFVDNVVKYHRTIETYVNGLIEAGFILQRLEEPEPRPVTSDTIPELELQRRRPPFLLIRARWHGDPPRAVRCIIGLCKRSYSPAARSG